MTVAPETETLPVAQARTGLPDAWDVLFRRFQLPLHAYVHGLLHEEQACLDVIQETFINAVRHIGTLRDDARFGSWLFGIAHQKCVQRWRRQQRDDQLLQELAGSSTEFAGAPDDTFIQQEQEASFMKLMDNLPAAHRSVLLLHFIEEFTIDEIAGITGAPPGTVKSRLHYAKQTLRRLVTEKV